MVLNSTYPLSLYLGASPYNQHFYLQVLAVPDFHVLLTKSVQKMVLYQGYFYANNHAVSQPICGVLGSLVVTLGWQ